jgi:two-component system, OmpR family, phosphate regulon sensor histidine kinase PhoR
VRHKLFWRLYASYLVVVVLCAVAVGWYGLHAARDLYLNESENDLHARAQLVSASLDATPEPSPTSLETTVTALDRASGTRISVIAPDGRVVADSEADPATLENHGDRPEVHTALTGGVGRSIRYSDTLHENMMYVAMPVTAGDGSLRYVVRTAIPLTAVDRAMQGASRRIIAITVLVALIAAAIGLFVSRSISGRMRRIREGAERFAAGDLTHKLAIPRTEEFAGVAESLNTMAEQLDVTITGITRERNEREAMLASMVEGVFATDDEGRVITMNDAAGRALGTTAGETPGHGIEEVSRNSDLQGFVGRVLAEQSQVESEIVMRSSDPRFDRYLQAHGAPMRGAEGAASGAVIVLHDVTRLRRLETVRRDFVANVSHELRTPVTSIKGFAETLLDGALDDPADARRFVTIIAGQADRLNAIIQDLLSLSRLEAESEDETLRLEDGPVCDILELAVESCQSAAQARGVTLSLSCRQGLHTAMDPLLLERAVVNLIDNALKFSDPDSSVEIAAVEANEEIEIFVADHGSGIERQHLPRLFERFYRVDTSRSRDEGGTGLGLAIVKHVAQLHGGRVTVESTPGVGSTFRIFLPA